MSTLEEQIDAREPAAAIRHASIAQQHTRWPDYSGRYVAQVLRTGAPLLLADLLSIGLATVVVFKIVGAVWFGQTANPVAFLLFALISVPVINLLFKLYPGTGLNPVVELRQTVLATASIYAAFVAASIVHDGRQGYTTLLAVACLVSMTAVPLTRSVLRRVLARCEWWGQPMLIFASNARGGKTYDHFATRPYVGLRPVGIINNQQTGPETKQSSSLGAMDRARSITERHGVFWAAVALPDGSAAEARKTIEACAGKFPHVLVVPNLVGLPTLWNDTLDCGDQLGIQMKANLLLPLPRLIKRALDLTLAMVAGIVLCPLILLIAALIKCTSAGPIFYRQERIGYGGHRFRVWKYRTMIQDADTVLTGHLVADAAAREEWESQSKLKNDPRITRVGRVLRSTSLDELPQIWNVLAGEMSLVGPRPIMNSEFSKYRRHQESFELYTKVLPGITGLWQVSGRSNTTYDRRVNLDTYYVRNWSPWLDLYILVRTFKAVLAREGAY